MAGLPLPMPTMGVAGGEGLAANLPQLGVGILEVLWLWAQNLSSLSWRSCRTNGLVASSDPVTAHPPSTPPPTLLMGTQGQAGLQPSSPSLHPPHPHSPPPPLAGGQGRPPPFRSILRQIRWKSGFVANSLPASHPPSTHPTPTPSSTPVGWRPG